MTGTSPLTTGWTFDIDPETAQWSLELVTHVDNTYGGRVVQLLSKRVTGMRISGHLPMSMGDGSERDMQFKAMENFERSVRSVMDDEARCRRPHKFSFPALGWEADVYLTGYSGVRYAPDQSAVEYTLSFEVDTGFEDVKPADGTFFMENVPDGVNYVRTKYNTPSTTSWDTVLKAVKNLLTSSGGYDPDNPPSVYEEIRKLSESSSDGQGGQDADQSESSTSTADAMSFAGLQGGTGCLVTDDEQYRLHGAVYGAKPASYGSGR